MKIAWEEERDKARRTVKYVVDGIVEGYYYEDKSDPGGYVVYAHNPNIGNYVDLGSFFSEEKAKERLKWLFAE